MRPHFLLFLATVAAFAFLPIENAASQDPTRGTGLPLPRFVSLKSDKVNVRLGPGQQYDVTFTFLREGLPVEITQEFDTWRKIRDSEGAEGWVFHSLLAGTRTALVTPWDTSGKSGPLALRAEPQDAARVTAYLEPKVLASVEQCHADWCLLSGKGFRGWIEQDKLWGVYPNEEIKG
jgi:SH3-like domain-containing protein